MTPTHSLTPGHCTHAPRDLFSPEGTDFFLDDAALLTLWRLAAGSEFTACGLLHRTGNTQSRTGRALLHAGSQWTAVLNSTAQSYRHHLNEVTDFIRAAFRTDAEIGAAL